MLGRDHDARQLLDRLMGLRNDLGLLAEEYDAVAGRMVGNFPQAFSHVSLVNSAAKLIGQEKPTSEHVILGLARRALTHGKGSPVPGIWAGFRPNHGVEAGRDGRSRCARGAARVIQEAVSRSSGGAVTPSRGAASGQACRASDEPGHDEAIGEEVHPAGHQGPDQGHRRTATGDSADGGEGQWSRAPAKKAPAKKSLAKKAAAKKSAAKKSVAKKSVAKRAPRREAPAKKPAAPAGTAKAPAAKATAAAKGR